MNRRTRNFGIAAAAVAALALAIFSVQAATGPRAESLGEVERVWLDANICEGALGDQLAARGFTQARSARRSDAVLDVKVDPLDSEVGASARYSARLEGDGGKLLFQRSDEESSITREELCADIADDILDGIRSG